ncbi:hypothetical protein JM47_01920 [Ureaplasma diversum]|uniref:Lipoprotein n=1 Tax=Ureaplasma diversum TaxID=42094 RepID=A0A0C5RPL7_9BACT|nr:hypothetical protein [Ureaplasma diversum]AJQ45349.1 hypothetical protein JM47_01920 [Ureaplasma diversum]
MKLKSKAILVFSSLSLVAITTSLIASCAPNTNSKPKNPNQPNLSNNKNKLVQKNQPQKLVQEPINSQVVESELKTNSDQKYTLNLQVNKAYANYYVSVSLLKEMNTSNQTAFVSNKAQVNDQGIVSVLFSDLEPKTKYLIKDVSIYNNESDNSPIKVESNKNNQVLETKAVESNSAPSLSTTPMISSELFNDGIVYKDLSNQLVYKKNVGSEFNLKEMTLTVNDVTNSRIYQIFGVVRDNVASFKLSNLQSGKFVVKKLQSKEQDKQVDIKEIEFEYIAKPETPFTINKGKTTLEIKVPQAKQNDYYYAIFKGDDNQEYKVLSQTQENKANYFDVGVLSKISKDQQYHLERVESNEINTPTKTRRVVIQNNGLRPGYKTQFSKLISKAQLNGNNLELETNNPVLDYLLSPIGIEQPNNKIIKRYLVAEFNDDLFAPKTIIGKYENNKFVFDTSELPTNHHWTLKKFFVKEVDLVDKNNNKDTFQNLDIKLNDQVNITKYDESKPIDEELQTKLKTVEINTKEDKSKTIKFYDPKLVGKKVKLHLKVDGESVETIKLEAVVDNGLVATFDVGKEQQLQENKKYIIDKITSEDEQIEFETSNLSNVEKYFYKNKYLINVKTTAFEGEHYNDVKIALENLTEYLSDDDKKHLFFVFEYQGKAQPHINASNHLTGDKKLDAKEHEKIEKEVPLKDLSKAISNEAIVNLNIPFNRHFKLKRVELKLPNRTILLFKNDNEVFNLWNSYGIKGLNINKENTHIQIDLVSDKPKKHININYSIYFKLKNNQIKIFNDNIPMDFDAKANIVNRRIPLSNLGFDISGATVLAAALNDDFHEKFDILGKEIVLSKN